MDRMIPPRRWRWGATIASIASIAMLLVPARAYGARYLMAIVPDAHPVRAGATTTLRVGIDTEGAQLNVFTVSLEVPEGVSVVAMAEQHDQMMLWVERPTHDAASKLVRFSGGVPGGFQGRLALLELAVRAERPGTYRFRFTSDSAAYANDGIGTLVAAAHNPFVLTVEGVREIPLIAWSIGALAALVMAAGAWWGYRKRRAHRAIVILALALLPFTWVDAASLSFDPATVTVEAGSELDVTVIADTAGEVVNLLSGTVTYPADVLTGLRISTTPSMITHWIAPPSFDAAAGTVAFVGGLPTPGFTGRGAVFSLTFRVARAAVLRLRDVQIFANDGNGTELADQRNAVREFTVALAEPEAVRPREAPREGVTPREAPPSEAPPTATTPVEGSPLFAPAPVGGIIPPIGELITPAPQPLPGPGEAGGAPTPATAGSTPPLPPTECGDGIDNDGDGVVDYPADPGCTRPDDDSEQEIITRSLEAVTNAVKVVQENVVQTATRVQQTKLYRTIDKQILSNPVVEEAAEDVAAPAVVAVAAANIGTAVNLTSLLLYLRGLFTQPLLLLTRRKRMRWGVVYSALSKRPIDLAQVRLVDVRTGAVRQTRVTDVEGRYLFSVEPGMYRLTVQRDGFTFPCKILGDRPTDGEFTDCYYGAPIEVATESAVISRAIPLDSEDRTETAHEVIRRFHIRRAQKVVAWSGPLLALATVTVNPTPVTTLVLIIQLLSLALFQRLAVGRRPKPWGVVRDAVTRQSIARAIIRVFSAEFDKLLETYVTDRHGRYAFLVDRGVFYLTAQKPGYESYRSDQIDRSASKREGIITWGIALTPKSGQPPPVTNPPPPPPPSPPPPPPALDGPPHPPPPAPRDLPHISP